MKKLVLHHKGTNVFQQIDYVIAKEGNYLFNTYILSWSSTFRLQRTRNEQTDYALL